MSGASPPESVGLRINLGSGTVAPPGWVNIDRSPGLLLSRVPGLIPALRRTGILKGPQGEVAWPRNVRRWDVTRGLPFADAAAEAVYSSHMLEHLPRQAATRLVRESRRVLRPDGVLRLAVPDLRAMAQAFVASEDPEAARIFMQQTGLGVEEAPRGWSRLIAALSGARHRWMYDEPSLRALCLRCGFGDTAVCRYREGRCPDLEHVEHRPDSLFIEAYAGRPRS